jgi:hypothetical protein
MFKIITVIGDTILTEKPNFIRRYKNGYFILCDRKKAEGIAYAGTPYLFEEGNVYSEIDSGDEIRALYAENERLRNDLAATDEAAIELFETALIQEEINAEQDEAIITIYEMMEVVNNG